MVGQKKKSNAEYATCKVRGDGVLTVDPATLLQAGAVQKHLDVLRRISTKYIEGIKQ